MELKLTSIDFSRRVAEGSKAPGSKLWVTNLLIVPRTFAILTANIAVLYYLNTLMSLK